MKKNLVLFATLLGLVLVSCKQEKKEWSRFIGFTPADIVGEYTFSNAADAFSNLIESDEGHLCPEALVNVTSPTSQTVSITVKCPDHNLQKTFSGKPSLTPNAFQISMHGAWSSGLRRYGLTAEVMKNAQNFIRLRGNVSEDHYEREYNTQTETYDTLYMYSVKYYFDVTNN